MTNRERMLALVQGRDHDRVPFVQYENCGAPNNIAWSAVGRDRMGVLRWTAVHRHHAPNCRFESETFARGDRTAIRTKLHTPAGTLTEERVIEPTYGSSAAASHYVKDTSDYPVLAAYLRDLQVIDDTARVLGDVADLRDDGLPHVAIDRTPYQQLWVQWVSLEDLPLHLADDPDAVEECISLMRSLIRRQFEIVRTAPIPYVVFPDNITAPAIGDTYFRRYCVPLYRELAEILDGSGKPVFVHMDGDLKPLWSAIGESGILGIDSLSPPPDNDTSVGEAARLWPTMRLCPNFPSSVHLASPSVVYETTMEMLKQAGHTGRLQIQISENVPPDAYRTSYPAIVEAIDDYARGLL